MQFISEVRGKRKRSNAPSLPLTTTLNGKHIERYQSLLEHPIRAMGDDRLASSSLLLKRAVNHYCDHVNSLTTPAAIEAEKLRILQVMG
jgi:hypothetical protein